MNESIMELERRYRGIIYQALRAGGASEEKLNDKYAIPAWEATRLAVRSLVNVRGFAGVLWNEVVRGLFDRNRVQFLKHKFMLRQFIEELPDSDERGILMCVYHGREASQENMLLIDTVNEVLERIGEKIDVVLKGHCKDLTDLTDRVITDQLVNSGIHPRQYAQWLFMPKEKES